MSTKLYMVALGLTLVLGGCATTADYSELVSRLEEAINDSATSIEAIDSDITARQNAILKNEVVAGKLLLDTADNACAAGTDICSLKVIEVKKDGELIFSSAYPLQSSMPKGLKALNMVKIYVSRLKSIIETDTAAKVTASVNATLGSLEDIANQLAEDNGNNTDDTNKFTEYKEPTMGIIEWIAGNYVEQVKVEALSKATRDAHPVIEDLTEFYATAAQSQELAEFKRFHYIYIKKQEDYDEKGQNEDGTNPITANSVDTYVSAVADYEVALKAQSANPLDAFKIAHKKLMEQLNGTADEQTTLVDVASAIERLEQEAKKIKALVDAFKKKSNNTNNGGLS